MHECAFTECQVKGSVYKRACKQVEFRTRIYERGTTPFRGQGTGIGDGAGVSDAPPSAVYFFR
jgi:hypothetical protein